MEPESIRAITTLLAVVLGFFLSQLSEYFRRRRESKKQKENIHYLVENEIRNNINLIREFWVLVIERIEGVNQPEGSPRINTMAKIIARSPLPYLSNHVWHSNLNEIPRFFSKDKIDSVWKFFQLLHEIEKRKVFFDQANESRLQSIQQAKGKSNFSLFLSEHGFNEQIKQHVTIFENMIKQIISYEAGKA